MNNWLTQLRRLRTPQVCRLETPKSEGCGSSLEAGRLESPEEPVFQVKSEGRRRSSRRSGRSRPLASCRAFCSVQAVT